MDRASTGGVFTYTFEPGDPTGTTLSLAFGWFGVPIVGGVLDRVSWDGDRDLDLVLANIKKAIES